MVSVRGGMLCLWTLLSCDCMICREEIIAVVTMMPADMKEYQLVEVGVFLLLLCDYSNRSGCASFLFCVLTHGYACIHMMCWEGEIDFSII